MKKRKFSIRELATKTGHDRATLNRWLAGITSEPEALAAIAEHEAAGGAKPGTVDPKTGLSWFQAKLRDDVIEKRRLNEIAEKAKCNEWFPTQLASEIFKSLIERLENIPGRLASEQGLTGKQVIAMRRLIDEARAAVGKQIRNMPTEANEDQNRDR